MKRPNSNVAVCFGSIADIQPTKISCPDKHQKLIDEKRAQYMKKHAADLINEEGFSKGALLCNKCSTKAVIIMDGSYSFSQSRRGTCSHTAGLCRHCLIWSIAMNNRTFHILVAIALVILGFNFFSVLIRHYWLMFFIWIMLPFVLKVKTRHLAISYYS